MSETPPWLQTMRACIGIVETPGAADNPKIMAMRDTIAETYDDMAAYCASYKHDATPWCGLAAAYCMTMAGIRPPYQPPPAPDTDRWLWARCWGDDLEWGTRLTKPQLGCVVVLTRSGGGHVTFYESTSGNNYICCGGNQSDAINKSSYPISSVVALMWPKAAGPVPVPPTPQPQPPAARRTLSQGMTGADVALLQVVLGIPTDGDFGPVTNAAVKGYQAATGLVVDGVVGQATWAQIDALQARVKAGSDRLPASLADQVLDLVNSHPLASFTWPDRGRAPIGYTQGMALAFGLAVQAHQAGSSAALAMAQAAGPDADKDALTWYAPELAALGWRTDTSGLETLRTLFALLIGLGMRESSGDHWAGRDTTASNVTAETAEAGLFQTSWNVKSSSPEMVKLFDNYWADPNGFNDEFDEAVPSPSTNDLQNYGSGQGAAYQWLAKYAPAFAAFTTAVGLRVLRKHWGPINRKEVTLTQQADDLLQKVAAIVLGVVPPAPEPEPEPEVATVNITTTGDVVVVVNGQPVVTGTA